MSKDSLKESLSIGAETPKLTEGAALARDVKSLNRLAVCQNFEEVAAIFLENPAAFTTNGSGAVASNTKLSLGGAVSFSRYLALSGEGYNIVRLNNLEHRFAPRAPKKGIDQHGQAFTRQEKVPEVTMQTTEFLFPEIIVTLFKRGVEQDKFCIPAELTESQFSVLLDVLFSAPPEKNHEQIKSVISDLKIKNAQLETLYDYLFRLNGNVVGPLIENEVGQTDLAVNTIISFRAKLEIFLMLKQT